VKDSRLFESSHIGGFWRHRRRERKRRFYAAHGAGPGDRSGDMGAIGSFKKCSNPKRLRSREKPGGVASAYGLIGAGAKRNCGRVAARFEKADQVFAGDAWGCVVSQLRVEVLRGLLKQTLLKHSR